MNNFLNIMSEEEKKEQELFKENAKKLVSIANEFLEAFTGACDTKFTNTEYVLKITPTYSHNVKQYIEFVAYPEITFVLFHNNSETKYCDLQNFRSISDNALRLGFLRKL